MWVRISGECSHQSQNLAHATYTFSHGPVLQPHIYRFDYPRRVSPSLPFILCMFALLQQIRLQSCWARATSISLSLTRSGTPCFLLTVFCTKGTIVVLSRLRGHSLTCMAPTAFAPSGKLPVLPSAFSLTVYPLHQKLSSLAQGSVSFFVSHGPGSRSKEMSENGMSCS